MSNSSRATVVWPLVGAGAVCAVVGIATNGAFAAWTATAAYLGSALWAFVAMSPSRNGADEGEI